MLTHCPSPTGSGQLKNAETQNFPRLLLVWFFGESGERKRKLLKEIRRNQLSPEARAKKNSRAKSGQVCHWLLVGILALAIGIITVVAFTCNYQPSSKIV